jgi:hypothetical protein
MERRRIDEIDGWITVKRAMEMLGVSRERVMTRISTGTIEVVYWEDRLMLKKADVEALAAKPRKSGRPRTRPLNTDS